MIGPCYKREPLNPVAARPTLLGALARLELVYMLRVYPV